jgi:hypothetical protein
VFEDPCTETPQQEPFAVMKLLVPTMINAASLQSMVWEMPCPVMWVSPFFAAAAGAPAISPEATVTETAVIAAASVPADFGPHGALMIMVLPSPTAIPIVAAYVARPRPRQWFAATNPGRPVNRADVQVNG